MTDFTAYETPILAVPCPRCYAHAGSWCKRPSGHRAMHLHKDRLSKADEVFIDQHGEDAVISRTSDGWIITGARDEDVHPIEKSPPRGSGRSDSPSTREGDPKQ